LRKDVTPQSQAAHNQDYGQYHHQWRANKVGDHGAPQHIFVASQHLS
jgi:hypothetical protein